MKKLKKPSTPTIFSSSLNYVVKLSNTMKSKMNELQAEKIRNSKTLQSYCPQLPNSTRYRMRSYLGSDPNHYAILLRRGTTP